MIVANPKYRANPFRAIHIHGEITPELVTRLTPEIALLQAQNREPITAYIDSPGGNTSSANTLLRLLNASNQDFSPACDVITVVTSRAASAAADLLSSGDYAIAYPQSNILYHGTRTSWDTSLTFETTSMLSHFLRMKNDSYAMDLARKTQRRFMWRFVSLKEDFTELKKKNSPKSMSDLDCFLDIVSDKISEQAKDLVIKARGRHHKYDELLKYVIKKQSRRAKKKLFIEIEANILKDIVDFQVARNKKDTSWTFQEKGFMGLGDDFFLLAEYLNNVESKQFKNMCSFWGKFLISNSDSDEINKLDKKDQDDARIEKVKPQLQPVWTFFVALCHAMQEGENNLSATDAFWLGLIDEVMGVEGLPCIRFLLENKPDPPEPPLSSETAGDG